MLSDEIRAALLSTARFAAKKRGEQVSFRCPRHDDSRPSAWMRGGAWGCFTCGFKESIRTLAPLVGVQVEAKGYTLEDYAEDKGFPLSKLREFGLSTVEERGRAVVCIPYFDREGKLLRRRFRFGGSKWWEGKNQPIHLYGLDRLRSAEEGDDLLIVEGESDCHAAWLGGFHAVGVPGATAWKSEWAAELKFFRHYIWEEPDQGGAQFVQRLAADFPNAKVITPPDGVKDVADLRRKHGRDFPQILRGLMAEAVKIGTPKPPVVFDALIGSQLDRLLARKLEPVDAVPTPFPSWSTVCCDEGGRQGLARGWHVVAAAKTGTGKSILALNIAHKAMRMGERVCFLSLEMDQPQLETRMMAIVAGQPVAQLEQGRNFDRDVFRTAAAELDEIFRSSGGLFYSNRQPIHTLSAVLESMRYNHEVHGCRFFVLDYMQLAGNPNDPESITEVSHAVRQLTQELRVITVALSQFNRATSNSKERPTCQGLMGGSALENDADQVVLIDHSRMQAAPPPISGWDAWLILDKNRHGPLTEIPFRFDRTTLRMRELMVDEAPAADRSVA